MPPLERTDRLQLAVLWPATSKSNRYGTFVVGSPVEIKVRWIDTQSQALDPQGNVITVDATAVVGIDIPIGSQMWLGSAASLPGTGYMPEVGLMEVKTFNRTSDIKNRNRRRTVGMIRFRLPATSEG